MVSKLKFKSSKGKVSKKEVKKEVVGVEERLRDEDLMFINNKLVDISKMKDTLLESGWSSANVIGDLNGPAILIPLDQEGDSDRRIVEVYEDHSVDVSKQVDTDLEPVNFIDYNDDDNLHNIIPHASSQVLVMNSVLQLVGSKQEIKDSKLDKLSSVKLTLKSKYGFYLSCHGDDVRCDSKVLTDSEIFQFTKKTVNGKVRWTVQTTDNRKLYLLQNGQFKLIRDEEDLIEQYFIIRVQIQNTVNAKKIKLGVS